MIPLYSILLTAGVLVIGFMALLWCIESGLDDLPEPPEQEEETII